MVLNPETKYPNRLAYVLKLRRDATAATFAGRVENLVTGQQFEFASGHALIESLLRDLEEASGAQAADASRG